MTIKELFRVSLRHTNDVVNHIELSQWQANTTCSPWDVHQLLNHLTYEWLWAPELFAGKTVAQVGDKFEGDVLGNDPINSYNKSARAIESAVKNLDLASTVHLSYADVPAREYLFQLCIEALIHGWDIATSIGYGTELPQGAVQTMYELSQKHMADINSTNLYGSRLETPKDAEVQVKLLAIFGRKAWPKSKTKKI